MGAGEVAHAEEPLPLRSGLSFQNLLDDMQPSVTPAPRDPECCFGLFACQVCMQCSCTHAEYVHMQSIYTYF